MADMLFEHRLVTKGLYSKKDRCGMLFRGEKTGYLRYHEASADIRGQSSCSLNCKSSKASLSFRPFKPSDKSSVYKRTDIELYV